ncbi:MAG: gamma-glutamyltransferase [Cyanobacteria bacterium P01_G01_bin.38]
MPTQLTQTDPSARSQQGMVVSPHTLASRAGVWGLRQGGSAVDAAIATHAALSVVYPHMTGLGGDAFWLIHEARTHQQHGLNGSGGAAQTATLDHYRDCKHIPQRGPRAAITVPGALDSWWQAHQRFGKLPWVELFKPAVQLASQGYALSASQARWTQKDRALLEQYGGAESFLPDGEVPRQGTVVKNMALARALSAIATKGIDIFYKGEIAQRMVDCLSQQGGLLSLADLADYRSEWVTPIKTTYRDRTIYELPPNTQGLAVLEILNIIEPFDLLKMGANSADYYHLMVEATKLAFCDRDRWLGDPNFVEIPVETLISKPYADRRRARLSLSYAQQPQAAPIGGDTVYAAVVDSDGNAVSTIQSLYFDYGCGIVPPGLGFVLNNRGSLFSLAPDHANALAPGKRPFHTLIPAMALAGNQLDLVFGTMGGEGQPQTQLALLTRVLDFGFDLQTAVNLPRWRWGRAWGDASAQLVVENRIPVEVRRALSRRGHAVRATTDWSDELGHAHMIRRLADGSLEGACDPRSDGIAVGV